MHVRNQAKDFPQIHKMLKNTDFLCTHVYDELMKANHLSVTRLVCAVQVISYKAKLTELKTQVNCKLSDFLRGKSERYFESHLCQ